MPPSPREVLCDVHETRPGGHPATAHDGSQGVERQESQNARAARIPAQDVVASVHAARTPESCSEGVSNRGRPGEACPEGLADIGASLGIPSLGPPGQAADPGHQAAHPACGPHPNTHVDVERAPWRDHPDFQIGASDAQDRSASPPATTFKLEVSLRGQTALEMHEAFAKLAACSVTHLIGVSIKRDSLPQSPLARQLADLTYRRR